MQNVVIDAPDETYEGPDDGFADHHLRTRGHQLPGVTFVTSILHRGDVAIHAGALAPWSCVRSPTSFTRRRSAQS